MMNSSSRTSFFDQGSSSSSSSSFSTAVLPSKKWLLLVFVCGRTIGSVDAAAAGSTLVGPVVRHFVAKTATVVGCSLGLLGTISPQFMKQLVLLGISNNHPLLLNLLIQGISNTILGISFGSALLLFGSTDLLQRNPCDVILVAHPKHIYIAVGACHVVILFWHVRILLLSVTKQLNISEMGHYVAVTTNGFGAYICFSAVTISSTASSSYYSEYFVNPLLLGLAMFQLLNGMLLAYAPEIGGQWWGYLTKDDTAVNDSDIVKFGVSTMGYTICMTGIWQLLLCSNQTSIKALGYTFVVLWIRFLSMSLVTKEVKLINVSPKAQYIGFGICSMVVIILLIH